MSDRILFALALIIIVAAVGVAACSDGSEKDMLSPSQPVDSNEPTGGGESKPVFITDINGRNWDITHARDMYGMQPEYFNFGIGAGAIPSVDETEILNEGDTGYPGDNSGQLVFGVDYDGEQRAYSVSDLREHEVFNDTYDGLNNQHLAVTF